MPRHGRRRASPRATPRRRPATLQTAYDCYLRAALFLGVGYHPLYGTPVDPRLVDAFHLQMETFAKALRLGVVPGGARRVPYEGTKIPAWFVRTHGHEHEQRPTILVGGGWDSTMVENYLGMGVAALERGYHVLLHDGPGQGTLLVDEGLPLRHDWEQVVTPVVDAALAIDVVDPDGLVYQPWSLGGYMAPARRRARAPPRRGRRRSRARSTIGGKIAGPLKMLGPRRRRDREAARALGRRREESWTSSPVQPAVRLEDRQARLLDQRRRRPPGFMAEMMQWKLTPEEIAGITTPMLVTAAESDPVAAEAKALYDALPGPKTLLEFTDAEGAGMHCEMMNRSMANRRILDWLDDTL